MESNKIKKFATATFTIETSNVRSEDDYGNVCKQIRQFVDDLVDVGFPVTIREDITVDNLIDGTGATGARYGNYYYKQRRDF